MLILQSFDDFHAFEGSTQRAVPPRPDGTHGHKSGEGIRVEFYLPEAAYAPVLLRELVNPHLSPVAVNPVRAI